MSNYSHWNGKVRVTEEWVRENFDLDAERRTINETVRNNYDLDSLLDTNASVEETKWHFCKVMDQLTEDGADSTRVEVELDISEMFGSTIDIVVFNTISREETDREVIKRIKRREKEKIEREEKKRREEEKERQDYERLRKKFEGK